MTQIIRKNVDPLKPYLPMNAGTFEVPVTVGQQTRKVIFYIPDDAMASTSGVLLLPPSGVSAKTFLMESNWKDIADQEVCKERLILCVLESGEDGWDIQEPYGTQTGDVAYVCKAWETANLRNLCCIHEAKFYMVGYQNGGAIAQLTAMYMPAEFAGVASVDSPSLQSEYLTAAENDKCTLLHGFVDETARHHIRKQDIAVPMWLISSEDLRTSKEATYWKTACGISADCAGKQLDHDTVCYFRLNATANSYNLEREAFRVWVSQLDGASDHYGKRINHRIWKDFLYRVRRWMAEPGGDLRLTRDPVRDLGMEYHYELVDGWMREWYVYTPEKVKNSTKPVPLVFAIHGYSCSGEIYIGNSEWYRVADENGFIVIFPTAVVGNMKINSNCPEGGVRLDNVDLPAWNIWRDARKPDDVQFFLHMLEDISSRYPIDRSRIYATGHSLGSLMTHLLALTHPELFAAVAPCSGVLFMADADEIIAYPDVVSRKSIDLPIWMFVGEMEPWLIAALPEKGNNTERSIQAWWDLNRMPGNKPTEYDFHVHNTRWNELEFDKAGIPMIRYTWVEYMPHATMPEMSFRIWNEFFSHFQREKSGKLRYTP